MSTTTHIDDVGGIATSLASKTTPARRQQTPQNLVQPRWSPPAMGPERVFPPCEDDEKSPRDGGTAWSGGEDEQEDEGAGYSYQPLSQDADDGAHGGLQHRMEVMGLHLPEAPPQDSDEEEGDEAEAERSRASIPMDAAHVELVKETMAAVALPTPGVPAWAREISDEQWRELVRRTLRARGHAD
ncbi:male-enhanced antigen 1 [Stigmatopora argus]